MDLRELQDVIERTFGERDRARGTSATVAWLAEEIGEVSQVVGKIIGTGGETSHWDGAGPLDVRLEEEAHPLAAELGRLHVADDLPHLLVLEVELAPGLDDAVEIVGPGRRRPRVRGREHDARPPGARPGLVEVEEDRVAIVEELVRRAGGDLRLGGDQLHRDAADPLAVRELPCRLEDQGARPQRTGLAGDAAPPPGPGAQRKRQRRQGRIGGGDDRSLGEARLGRHAQTLAYRHTRSRIS